MKKPRITPLLQAQLMDELKSVRMCLANGWSTEGFNCLETLASMLNKEDGDKLLTEIKGIYKEVNQTLGRNRKSDSIQNYMSQKNQKDKILRNHIKKVFRDTMIVMYERGYMEDEGAKPLHARRGKLKFPTT